MGTMGAKGTLAIDQLSGFRVSSVDVGNGRGGLSYEGPIGFAIRSYSETPFPDRAGIIGPDTTYHTTSFWLAPSADFFVIDHLSIGGLIEFVSISTSVDVPRGAGVIVTESFPAQTSFTLLPRIGYLIQISDRFGIWPRGGIGYGSHVYYDGDPAGPTRHSIYGLLLDFDVGFIIRVTDSFFFRIAPEVTFALGANHQDTANYNTPQQFQTPSEHAGLFQFAGVAGIGVFWDL
jgi:hypothetical protein